MKTFSIKQIRLAAACALALGSLSAGAQSLAPINERELITANGSQVWMNGFGECWHSAFGPGPAANEKCGPQPVAAYVAPAQEKKTVVAAVVPAPVYERVTFDTNVMFDSGKSTLRPASRDSLDKFISQTKDLLDPSSMVAVGYADRQGTDAKNQTLSEDRVAAVKSYVVSQGVKWNTVGTSGAGENRPTTYLHECDKSTNAKTVACLQPDRHVFIQLSGNRIKQ
jgi:OOP family OmpA-OmpF porin